MNADTNTQKTAAHSTPAAAPADSQSAEEHEPGTADSAGVGTEGADAEEITSADVAEALGQLSDGLKADNTEDGEDAAKTEEAPDDEASDETPAQAETEEAAESDKEPAAEGDAAGKKSGGEDTESDQKADDEKPAEAEEGKVPPHQLRINELTARAKSSEEREAQLRERLSALEADRSGQFAESSFDHVEDLQGLAAAKAKLVRLHEWALRHEDGGKLPDGKNGEQEFTREEVANIRAQTFAQLQEELPKREQHLMLRQAVNQEAEKSYPWVRDTRQGMGAELQGAIEALPILRRIPSYRLIAANALVGEKLRRAGVVVDEALIARLTKEQASKAPGAKAGPNVSQAPRRIPPAAPARHGVVPPRTTPRAAEQHRARKSLSRSDGNVDALTASIAAKM